mmetsp:Transcript_1949/g.4194  ORF Transcript_1949/g.4194 Transcript_1949/m.4194 type:complete len:355 (-) Transcript_1949:367-1431(-)
MVKINMAMDNDLTDTLPDLRLTNAAPTRRPLITVLGGDDDEDPDDGPPALRDPGPPAFVPTPHSSLASDPKPMASEVASGPSLMEQLMEDAKRERAASEKARILRERASAKAKAPCVGGIKKGFLLGPLKQKRKPVAKKAAEDGAPPPLVTATEKIHTVRPKSDPNCGANGLVIDEVQEEMRKQKHSFLESLERGEFVNDKLLGRLQDNGSLVERLKDPRYSAALEDMRADPSAAMKKYRDVPDVQNFFREFCGILGDHFIDLDKNQKGGVVGGGGGEGGGTSEAGGGVHDKERAAADAVLNDPELREMLMDPKMKKVMSDCSRPGAMQFYMRHPEWGPKLRKMMDSGLLQVAS